MQDFYINYFFNEKKYDNRYIKLNYIITSTTFSYTSPSHLYY